MIIRLNVHSLYQGSGQVPRQQMKGLILSIPFKWFMIYWEGRMINNRSFMEQCEVLRAMQGYPRMPEFSAKDLSSQTLEGKLVLPQLSLEAWQIIQVSCVTPVFVTDIVTVTGHQTKALFYLKVWRDMFCDVRVRGVYMAVPGEGWGFLLAFQQKDREESKDESVACGLAIAHKACLPHSLPPV